MTTFEMSLSELLLELEQRSLLHDPSKDYLELKRKFNKPLLPIVYDTKKFKEVKKSPCLFFARKGYTFNAHSCVEDILSEGHFFIGSVEEIRKLERSSSSWIYSILNHPYFIGVTSSKVALEIAMTKAAKFNPKSFQMTCVTGTNGKTTVVQMLKQWYKYLTGKNALCIGTLGCEIGETVLSGSHVTMPDFPRLMEIFYESQKQDINSVFMEATSQGLKEERLGDIKCQVAAFTNFSQDHLDLHKTMEDYHASKIKLFRDHSHKNTCGVFYLNSPYSSSFIEAFLGHRFIGYGPKGSDKNFIHNRKGTFLTYEIKTESIDLGPIITINYKNQQFSFNTPVNASFFIDNLMCALCCLLGLGFSIGDLMVHIGKIQGVPGRFQKVIVPNQNEKASVFIDFAHTPEAVEKIIESGKQFLLNPSCRIIAVMGCGGDRDSLKRPLIGKILATKCDYVFLTSDNPRGERVENIISQMLEGVDNKRHIVIEHDRMVAIKKAISFSQQGDVVFILGKGHEKVQIFQNHSVPFDDYEIAKSVLRGDI